MSEYWISQAKKHCDFCKCWIADNKPSRDFHERGKRHQENVKKKIEDVRKKSVVKAQKEQEMSDSLKEMEENALRALKKDLITNPSMASQYGVKLKPRPAPKQYGPEPNPEPEISTKVVKEDDETESTEEQDKVADGDEAKTPVGTWHMAASDQGYPYYWNDITSEVNWVPPAAYLAQEAKKASSSADVEVDIEEKSDIDISENSTDDDDDGDDDGDDEEEEETSEKEAEPKVEVDVPKETEPSPAPKAPIHNDPVKKPKQPQPVMYKLGPSLAKKPKIEAPMLLSDIPLPPEDKPLPPPPGTGDAASEKEESEAPEEFIKRAPRPPKSNAAYGTWAQVEEQEEPSALDLGLPVKEKVEPVITVAVTEPRFKIREKTMRSLGSGPVFFKKPKKKITAAQFLRKREET